MLSRDGIFRDILATPDALAFVVNLLVAGEHDGCAGLDRVAELIPEPATRRRVRRHYEEEERHGVLFAERLRRLGRSPEPIPFELDYVAQLHADGWGLPRARLADATPLSPEEEVLVFCSSRVDEERGIREMGELREALRDDTDTVAVLDEILRDERGHVGYASFELRRLDGAGHGALIRRTLREYRRRDARVHARVASRVMDRLSFILGYPAIVRPLYRLGLLAQSAWERLTAGDAYDATELMAGARPLGDDVPDAS